MQTTPGPRPFLQNLEMRPQVSFFSFSRWFPSCLSFHFPSCLSFPSCSFPFLFVSLLVRFPLAFLPPLACLPLSCLLFLSFAFIPLFPFSFPFLSLLLFPSLSFPFFALPFSFPSSFSLFFPFFIFPPPFFVFPFLSLLSFLPVLWSHRQLHNRPLDHQSPTSSHLPVV